MTSWLQGEILVKSRRGCVLVKGYWRFSSTAVLFTPHTSMILLRQNVLHVSVRVAVYRIVNCVQTPVCFSLIFFDCTHRTDSKRSKLRNLLRCGTAPLSASWSLFFPSCIVTTECLHPVVTHFPDGLGHSCAKPIGHRPTLHLEFKISFLNRNTPQLDFHLTTRQFRREFHQKSRIYSSCLAILIWENFFHWEKFFHPSKPDSII